MGSSALVMDDRGVNILRKNEFWAFTLFLKHTPFSYTALNIINRYIIVSYAKFAFFVIDICYYAPAFISTIICPIFCFDRSHLSPTPPYLKPHQHHKHHHHDTEFLKANVLSLILRASNPHVQPSLQATQLSRDPKANH